MAFKKINFLTKIQEDWNVKISDKIKDRIKKCYETGEAISLEEYKNMRMNSYEQKQLQIHLSDEAFVWHVENAIKNRGYNVSSYELPDHYDHYLSTDGIDELLIRFKELKKCKDKL